MEDGEQDSAKKLVFVGSKTEEIAHRINKQQDIRLSRQIRHFEREKTVYLKSYKAEQQAVLEKHQQVKERLRELGYVKSTASSRNFKDAKHYETQSKVRFFITDSRNSSPKNCVPEPRRIQSAQ